MIPELTDNEIKLLHDLNDCKDLYESLDGHWGKTDNAFYHAVVIAENIVLARAGARWLYNEKHGLAEGGR